MEDVERPDELGNSNSKKDDESFDWLNDPAVILHDSAVAAYYNDCNELVVKQRDTLGEEPTLCITPENVEHFLKGLAERESPRSATKKLRVVE
jgi:hypothetical protein